MPRARQDLDDLRFTADVIFPGGINADCDRYLSTCIRGFPNHWAGDVQMKLRRIQ